MKQDYVNIHTHTTYSLQDALGQPGEILDLAKSKGFKAHAFTDHGNMNHVADAQIWQKQNPDFKVIHGCEFYLRESISKTNKMREELDSMKKLLSREQMQAERKKIRKYFHVIMLAKNKTGLEGLFELNYHAWRDGFYYKPCIDMALIEANEKIRGNVIVTSACLAGPIAQSVLGNIDTKVDALYKWFKKVFKNDYYLEVQINELADQAKVNNALIELDRDRLIFSNDNHYLCEAHSKTHSMLLNLQIGKLPNEVMTDDQSAESGVTWEFETKHLYLKDTNQIYRQRDVWQKDLKDNVLEIALRNTLEVEGKIETIQLETEPKIYKLPELKKDSDGFEMLKEHCEAALKKKKLHTKPEYVARLKRELEIIKDKKFYNYFLLVEKFIVLAKENDIAVGVGRGSAAGSLINYVLGITGLDPIKYGLFFERFLDYERNDYPDIDIDFDDNEKMKQVIQAWVGKENFAYISTFGSFSLLSLFRDMCRSYSVPLEYVNKIASDLDVAQKTYRRDHNIPPVEKLAKDVILGIFSTVQTKSGFGKKYPEIAQHMEVLLNQYKFLGTHAAGIIIYDKLYDKLPVIFMDGEMQTGFPESGTHAILSKFGWQKFDVLGLETLKFKRIINEYLGRDISDEIDPEKMNLTNPKLFEPFNKGLTIGVFQFGGSGITEFAKRVAPETFEEVCDISALYRPAPLNAGLDQQYIENKRKKSFGFFHDKLEKILAYSKGVLIYQEQLMQIANELGGISMSETNAVRKAISKVQNNEAVLELKDRLFAGFAANGLNQKQRDMLWTFLSKFGGYGFNKTHAYCYSFLTMQTAYMKMTYPAEFYAAYLRFEKPEFVTSVISEMKSFGLKLSLPKIGHFDEHIHIDGDTLYLGLLNLKGIGENAAKEIARVNKVNPIKTLKDFFKNGEMNYRIVNFEVQKVLIAIGFFDSIYGNRKILTDWLTYCKRTVKETELTNDFFQPERVEGNAETYYKIFQLKQQVQVEKDKYKARHGKEWQKKFKAAYPKPEVLHMDFEPYNPADFTDLEKHEHEIELAGYSMFDSWELMGFEKEIEKFRQKEIPLCYRFSRYEPPEVMLFMLRSLRLVKDKRGRQMAFAEFQDRDGEAQTVPIFSKDFKEIYSKTKLVPGHLYKTKLAHNSGSYGGFVLGIPQIAPVLASDKLNKG